MSIISQIAPFSDTADQVQSQTYINQITVTGNNGAVTYVTTIPSPDLVVSSLGQVTTIGTLDLGSYYVSGTDSDGNGNTGTWAFTLTVSDSIAPQVQLTPVLAAPSTGVEIAVPFHIDPATGGTAFLNQYNQILAQHIETIVLTSLGERVMFPTYGSEVESAVFSPISNAGNGALSKNIQDAIAKWEPAVSVASVTIGTKNPQSPEVLSVTVNFSIVPYTDLNTVTVTTGGNVQQVSSP